jgi:fructose-specific phosphotransferase system IIC component
VSYVALVFDWLIALIPLCVVVALWAAASRDLPVRTPWLVLAGLAGVFLIAWQQASDDEPHGGAVIAMVGLAGILVVCVAMLIGYLVRRKRSR